MSPVVDVHTHYVPKRWPSLADSVGGIATAVAVVGGTALAVDAVFPTTTCHAASPRTP